MDKRPLISVITVSYNAVSTIEQTILSVLNQSYTNIEYIIIDGGSTDGTVDIIKKYADKIAYWVSEPDQGIYDAMNKGIDRASGEWINFMNSGDSFFSLNTIADVFNDVKSKDVAVIYGDRVSVYTFGKYYHKTDSLDSFEKNFPIFHQSIFADTTLLKKYKFDLKYKICADYNQFFILYKLGYKFQYIPMYLSVCECETGVSTLLKNELLKYKEDYLIVNGKLDSFFKVMLIALFFKNRLRKFVKYINPSFYSDYQREKRLLKNKRITVMD